MVKPSVSTDIALAGRSSVPRRHGLRSLLGTDVRLSCRWPLAGCSVRQSDVTATPHARDLFQAPSPHPASHLQVCRRPGRKVVRHQKPLVAICTPSWTALQIPRRSYLCEGLSTHPNNRQGIGKARFSSLTSVTYPSSLPCPASWVERRI